MDQVAVYGSGWIWKRGRVAHRWVSRFYKIYADGSALYWNSEDTNKSPQGALDISKAKVVSVAESVYQRPHAFTLTKPGDDRVHVFAADTAHDRDVFLHWLVAAGCVADMSVSHVRQEDWEEHETHEYDTEEAGQILQDEEADMSFTQDTTLDLAMQKHPHFRHSQQHANQRTDKRRAHAAGESTDASFNRSDAVKTVIEQKDEEEEQQRLAEEETAGRDSRWGSEASLPTLHKQIEKPEVVRQNSPPPAASAGMPVRAHSKEHSELEHDSSSDIEVDEEAVWQHPTRERVKTQDRALFDQMGELIKAGRNLREAREKKTEPQTPEVEKATCRVRVLGVHMSQVPAGSAERLHFEQQLIDELSSRCGLHASHFRVTGLEAGSVIAVVEIQSPRAAEVASECENSPAMEYADLMIGFASPSKQLAHSKEHGPSQQPGPAKQPAPSTELASTQVSVPAKPVGSPLTSTGEALMALPDLDGDELEDVGQPSTHFESSSRQPVKVNQHSPSLKTPSTERPSLSATPMTSQTHISLGSRPEQIMKQRSVQRSTPASATKQSYESPVVWHTASSLQGSSPEHVRRVVESCSPAKWPKSAASRSAHQTPPEAMTEPRAKSRFPLQTHSRPRSEPRNQTSQNRHFSLNDGDEEERPSDLAVTSSPAQAVAQHLSNMSALSSPSSMIFILQQLGLEPNTQQAFSYVVRRVRLLCTRGSGLPMQFTEEHITTLRKHLCDPLLPVHETAGLIVHREIAEHFLSQEMRRWDSLRARSLVPDEPWSFVRFFDLHASRRSAVCATADVVPPLYCPQLPAVHQRRDALFSSLIRLVKPDKSSAQNRCAVVILHGQPSSGKSVLAASLCWAASVRLAWAQEGGIVWMPPAELALSPHELLQTVSSYRERVQTIRKRLQASARGNTSSVSPMLVVCDGWESISDIMFLQQRLPPRSVVLATMRSQHALTSPLSTEPSSSTGMSFVEVPYLSSAEAMSLFVKTQAVQTPGYKHWYETVAKEVVSAVGLSPQAVAAVGALCSSVHDSEAERKQHFVAMWQVTKDALEAFTFSEVSVPRLRRVRPGTGPRDVLRTVLHALGPEPLDSETADGSLLASSATSLPLRSRIHNADPVIDPRRVCVFFCMFPPGSAVPLCVLVRFFLYQEMVRKSSQEAHQQALEHAYDAEDDTAPCITPLADDVADAITLQVEAVLTSLVEMGLLSVTVTTEVHTLRSQRSSPSRQDRLLKRGPRSTLRSSRTAYGSTFTKQVARSSGHLAAGDQSQMPELRQLRRKDYVLHPMMREVCLERFEVDHHHNRPELCALHRMLLHSYKYSLVAGQQELRLRAPLYDFDAEDNCALPWEQLAEDGYFARHLVYHHVHAGELRGCRESLLLSAAWHTYTVSYASISSLLRDFQLYLSSTRKHDDVIVAVTDAIAASEQTVSSNPHLLGVQMHMLLAPLQDTAEIEELLQQFSFLRARDPPRETTDTLTRSPRHNPADVHQDASAMTADTSVEETKTTLPNEMSKRRVRMGRPSRSRAANGNTRSKPMESGRTPHGTSRSRALSFREAQKLTRMTKSQKSERL